MLAALSGVLTASCFPPFDLCFLLPVCLLPLLYALAGRSAADRARLGGLFGLVFFGVLLWWIAPTISTYGSMPPWASWPVLGLLVLYLAAYPGLWAALGAGGASRRPLAVLLLPASWTLLEWARSHLLTGFPWGLLAYSLAPETCLIQAVDLFGPLGISFLAVLVNVAVFHAVEAWRGAGKKEAAAWLALAALPPAVLSAYGVLRMDRVKAADPRFEPVQVMAIQGSIDQDKKWNPSFQQRTLEIYESLTASAMEHLDEPPGSGNGPVKRIAVWPETAVPFFFQDKGPLRERMVRFARRMKIPILFGSPAYRQEDGRLEYLNSAFLLAPDGSVAGRYDKRHLVPFGEYLPWGWFTSWAKDMIPRIGDFSPGLSPCPLVFHGIRIGILVCFESIFPSLAGESVGCGANILAVLTNDAWFGRTGAPFQHEAMAVFRAVETRRWLVRAANTGVSSIISPWGTRTGATGLFQPAYLTGTVRLRTDRTLYSRAGDLPVLTSCLFLVLISCYISWEHGSRRCRKGPGR